MAGMTMGESPADKAFMRSMQTKDMLRQADGRRGQGLRQYDASASSRGRRYGLDELQCGKDAMLRELATAIIAVWEKEIAMMKAWQAKHEK